VGAEPNGANVARVEPIYLRALGEALLRTADRYQRDPLPFDELVADAILRSSFGLSRAEARLANYLLTGRKLPVVAQDLGVSYENARNQLKSIFAKMNVSSQSELLVILTKLNGQ